MCLAGCAQPVIGVGAVVFDSQGRVLLVRRAQPPNVGLWSVPGGRLGPGESLVECCRREVLEETGIEVEPGPLIAIADRAGDGFRYIIIDFAATLKATAQEDPVAATDVSDARWVEPAELGRYVLVEDLAAVISAALACLNDGTGFRVVAESGSLFLPAVPR